MSNTPYTVEPIPADIVNSQAMDLIPEVTAWCYKEIRGMWVSIYSCNEKKMRVEFEREIEAIHFMMRWCNGL